MKNRIRFLLFLLSLFGVGFSTAQAGVKRVPVGDTEVIQPSQAKYKKAKIIRAVPVEDKQAPIVRKGKIKAKSVDPKVLEPEVVTATTGAADQTAIVASDRKLPKDSELLRALEKTEVEVLDLTPVEAMALEEALREVNVHNISKSAPENPVVEKKKKRRSEK